MYILFPRVDICAQVLMTTHLLAGDKMLTQYCRNVRPTSQTVANIMPTVCQRSCLLGLSVTWWRFPLITFYIILPFEQVKLNKISRREHSPCYYCH